MKKHYLIEDFFREFRLLMQTQSLSINIDPRIARNLDISIALCKIYYQPKGYHGTANHLHKAIQDAGYDFSLKEVRDWLEKQAIYQIYRPRPRYIPQASFNKITCPNEVHQADVLYMPHDKVGRITYLFCLNIVDVASRYKASVPIGSTSIADRTGILTSSTIARAFKEVYNDVECPLIWPKVLQVDGGSEFKGSVISLMDEKGVRIRVGSTHKHQSIVERFNRTLAEKLFRIQDAIEMVTKHKSTKWVENLPVVLNELNHSVTRLIGISPAEAIQKDKVLASPSKIHKNRPVGLDETPLSAGTLVRYLLEEKRRATDPVWSGDIFSIESSTASNGQPVMYRLVDGPKKIFVREELLVVPSDTMLPPANILHIT